MQSHRSLLYRIVVILTCASLLNLSTPLQYVLSQTSVDSSVGADLPSSAGSGEISTTPTPLPASESSSVSSQSGAAYLPVIARDGVAQGNPPVQTTESGWVSGVVYDSTTCDQHLTQCQPLAGVRITLASVDTVKLAQVRAARKAEIVASGYSQGLAPIHDAGVATPIPGEVTTDGNGAFSFPVSESGTYWLRGDKGGYTYAQRQINIIKDRSTATNAIYLTPLDSKVTSCTNAGCTHTNSDGSIQLVIPQGAIPAGQPVAVTATNFKQVEFLPSGDLPEGTWETYAFNLGGDSEYAFQPGKTATVRLRNDKGFAPRTKVPLGYWNQATQAWEHSGTGTVDASGQWVEMSVAHFSNYDCNDPISDPTITPEATDATDQGRLSCNGQGGCFVSYKSGELREWVDLPSLQVLGGSVTPQLRYSTERTDPSGVIDTDLNLKGFTSASVVPHIGWELYIEGEKTDSFTFQANVQSNGAAGRYRYFWDGRNARGEQLPPGVYSYKTKLSVPYRGQYCYALNGIFGNPPDCANGATGRFVDAVKDVWVNGTVLLNPQVNSSLGAGWQLAGVQRLYPQPDGGLLLINGDGSLLPFKPGSFRFDDFADLSRFKLNGRAGDVNTPAVSLNGHTVLRLTQGTFNQSGSAFFADPVPLGNGSAPIPFSTHFRFQVNEAGGWENGGDGLIFALVPAPTSLGGIGGYLGYTGIKPSLAVEFDTFTNAWDANGNHVGVDLNGDVTSVIAVPVAKDMTKGDIWSAWVDYDASATRLEVRLADTDVRPASPVLTYTVDLPALFGSSKAYVGFSAGAASAYGAHDIHSWEYTSGENKYFIAPVGEFSSLAQNSDSTYTRSYPDGTQAHFNAGGVHDYTLNPDGRKTVYTYNADGSVATMGIVPPGEQTPRWAWTFNYTGGRLSTISDPAGRTTTVTVDARNDLVAVTLPDTTTRRFAYDGNHLMVQGTDQNGGVTDYAYDKYGSITTLTEPARPVYNPATGAPETRREVRTFTTSDTGYAFINDSAAGSPAAPAPSVPLSSALIDRVVYGRGQLSGHTDRWGSWLDRTDGVGRTTTYARDEAGNITRQTYPNGECVAYTYDGNANPLTETYLTASACAATGNVQGQTWKYTYESRFNRLKTATDPLGNVTTYIYDYEENQGNAGHLIRTEYPQVRNEANALVTPRASFTYNALGLLDSATDMQGIITRYRYTQGAADEASGGANPRFAPGVAPVSGLLAQVIEDSGDAAHLNLTTNYQDYDSQGNPQTVTDSHGNVTRFTYDGMGRPLTLTDPLGEVTTYAYDSRGNLVRLVSGHTADGTTGRNVVTQFTYDAADHLLSERTEADGQVQAATLTYDINGEPATYTNSEGHKTVYGHDDADQLTGVTDPLGQTTQLGYTGRGQWQSAVLANSTVVSFTYDALGNLTGLVPPGRTAHRFDYTARGEVAAYRPPALNTGATNTAYTYDALGQLTRIARPDGKAISYVYDGLQRPYMTAFSRGQLAYAYHPATGQLTGITAPGGVNLAFGYDRERLTSAAWSGPVNGSVQFTYDATGRTTGVGVNGVSPVIFQYDASDHLTQAGLLAISRLRQSRQVQGTTLEQINDTWTYDAFGKATRYQANVGAAALYAVDYTYDTLNRIAVKAETIGGVTATYAYTYDAVGRLTEVKKDGATVESYTYDANGNRLVALGGVTGTYDAQDRLLTYGGATYAYTANGDLSSKTVSGQQTAYTYDEFGNLTAVTLPTTEKVEYLIDGQNRRIGKKVSGVLVQGFLYEDTLRPVIELNGAGNVVSRFVYGERINVPEYMVKLGVRYRLILDHLGSVRLVVNTQTGEIAQRLDYDAFGRVVQDTSPGFQPFGFAGGLYDFKTGLVRFGARDYDAETGRWTTKDPIGFEGGDGNLYGYVGGDPVNRIDPSGNWAFLLPVLLGVLGAVVDADIQLWRNGGNLDCVDWTSVTVSGLLGALPFGRVPGSAVKGTEVIAIGATGKFGEISLKEFVGGVSQVPFQTSLGRRVIDQLARGIAHESKVGYTTLTKNIQVQIAKDIELINLGRIEGASWHFFRSPTTGKLGPSGPLHEALSAAGIKVVIYK